MAGFGCPPRFNWANTNREVFKAHDVVNEGTIIRGMSAEYAAFVSNYGKTNDAYADPWLVAQAKMRHLKIISQETPSGNPKTPKLPNVCGHSTFKIECLDLLHLAKEQGWSFR